MATMHIKFNPSNDEKGSGTTSTINWDNPSLLESIETLIRLRKDEQIESLEITKDGIVVRISNKAGWRNR